jgi:hypothetical protein
MLSPEVLAKIAEIVQRADDHLCQRMEDERAGQEPVMTAQLMISIEEAVAEIDGVRIELTVVDSMGRGAAERALGADIVGVIHIDVGGTIVTKGFLAQAKRSGTDGVVFVQTEKNHWLYRGPLHLKVSGTLKVGRPSQRLTDQCNVMLQHTPESYVFVYHPVQTAVVSAVALAAARSKNSQSRTALGTKTLADFFVHLADCFVGDRNIVAQDADSIRALASRLGATTGLLLTVQDSNDRSGN